MLWYGQRILSKNFGLTNLDQSHDDGREAHAPEMFQESHSKHTPRGHLAVVLACDTTCAEVPFPEDTRGDHLFGKEYQQHEQ